MITRHKIIESYNIAVTCDKCKTIMSPSVYNAGTPENHFQDGYFTSTCPNCGNTVNTGRTSYPYQQFVFDIDGEEVKE